MAFQRGVDKWKLKKWLTVYAPAQFNSVAIGELPVNDPGAAVGRSIVVGLDTLTHNPSHAYTNVLFKVSDAEGSTAHAALARMELVYSYVRSLARRYHSISDCVLPVTTRDGVPMVAKLLIVTKARSTRSRLKALRKEAAQFVKEYFGDRDVDAVVGSIIDRSFQGAMTAKLGHIAALNKVEMRKLELKATDK